GAGAADCHRRFFFSSRRRHTRFDCDWSSDVCSSDLLTEPYADDLLRTFRYTAFGAVYEDTSTFEQPGGGWDRLLGEYVRGERSRPAWALAESGFHGHTAGKQVGPVQTVFLVAEKSEAGVLAALRQGRMYAVQRTSEVGFDLTEFSATAGAATAGMGDTLRAPAGTP